MLKIASKEGCNYFTFNIPNTVCNDCGHIDKRYLKECPHCHSKNLDYLTRIIGYMKRISNFSAARQVEAAKRFYAVDNGEIANAAVALNAADLEKLEKQAEVQKVEQTVNEAAKVL